MVDADWSEEIFHSCHDQSLTDFLPKITAPTIAEINRMEATSNGRRNLLKRIFPTSLAVPKPSVSAKLLLMEKSLNEAAKTNMSKHPETTAANLSRNGLCGSVSLLRLSNMITNKKRTIMAPA